MYFYIPTKIYQEEGCVRAHGQELAALGSRALIVTGKHSSRKNGSLQDAVSVLKEHNISVSGYLSPETTRKIGQILGVDVLLIGATIK